MLLNKNMYLKFVNFIKLIFPKDWRGVIVRLRDNYKLTKNLSMAFKVALKEKINVTGRLDYKKAEILMDLSSYKQIRRLRASKKEPETVKTAPHTTPVSKLDGVAAARKPILKYDDILNHES